MKRKKVDIFRLINIFLFILIYALRSFTDSIFISKGVESNIWINLKYVVLLIAIILGIFQKNKNKNKIFYKESKNLSIGIIGLTLISLFFMIFNWKFSTIIFQEIFKLTLPIIYVFIIFKIMSFDDIYMCMKYILIFSIIGYIIEIGISNFSFESILKINFKSSYSPFESSFACGTAMALCAYFMYYRKNKLWTILSFVFVIFTFKRLSVLFSIVLLILPKIINVNKNISKKQRYILKLIFILLTIAYFRILLPDCSILFKNIFGEEPRLFTMGRSDFLHILLNSNYSSYGLGSTTDYLGFGLEMDLIRIMLETSIIGLIIFINFYWNASGENYYTNIYMVFQFLNLLTSHSLSNSFNWILVFITICSISNYRNNNLNYLKEKRKLVKQ